MSGVGNERALSELVKAQNWGGAMAHVEDAASSEVFYQDPEDENRTALMKGELTAFGVCFWWSSQRLLRSLLACRLDSGSCRAVYVEETLT